MYIFLLAIKNYFFRFYFFLTFFFDQPKMNGKVQKLQGIREKNNWFVRKKKHPKIKKREIKVTFRWKTKTLFWLTLFPFCYKMDYKET